MAGLPPPAHRPALGQEPADTDVACFKLSEALVIQIICSDGSVVLALLARVSLTPTRSRTERRRAADGPEGRSVVPDSQRHDFRNHGSQIGLTQAIWICCRL